ncbi:tetratricopeptide repeat protein [Streptomyces xylophagus]|uniref:tetratricopeptide repeat protein n=1 Tax=Streptomyces xylophagus TaxID=285514 RepID=UPI00068C1EA1|nr:tetratricopeptide repeat protein [Streptomyces xylophagus]
MGDGDHIDFRGSTFYGPVTGKVESPRAAPSPTALSALPAAPAVFTGREDEVAELLGALDPAVGEGSESVVISAVSGLGGVGKTALALCVAHAARERGWFAGGALFVDLRGYDEVPVTADQAVLALLRALGVGDADLPPTADEQYARYRGELSSREPVLIVLDNASDPAQIAPLLPGEGSGHRVLVTSREVQDSLPVRQFRVDGLTPDASRELVDRSLRRYDPGDRRVAEEPEAVRQLGELCGHLPLALLIVSALLRRRRQRSVATLVDELQVAGDRVRALRAKGVDQYGQELSLRPVFDVMYGRLEPELARVFRLLGQAPGDSIGIWSAVNLVALVPERLEPLLDELTASSLLTAIPGGERWVMHDLVRIYAQLVAAEDPGARREVAEARMRMLDFYFHTLTSANALIERTPEEAPHDSFEARERALNWLDSERKGLLAAAQWTDGDDDGQPGSLSLALNLDSYLDLRRAFDDWATVAQTACETARRVHDSEAEATASNALGRALFRLRRFEEASTAERRALRVSEQLGDRVGQAAAWNMLGVTLRALLRYDAAIDAHLRSARIYADVGLRRQTAHAHINLGGALGDAGRTDEAYDAFSEALVIHMELGDKEGEAAARSGLGTALLRLDRHEEAITALTRALGLYAESGDWHSRATSWNNLGMVWRQLGLLSEALAAHTRALNWFIFLHDRYGEASAWGSMGVALGCLDRTEEALSAAHQALDLFRAFGDEYQVALTERQIAAIKDAQR